MDLELIEHSELNQDFKGWPKGVGDKKISCIQDQGWNLLNGDLPLPVATLKPVSYTHLTLPTILLV